MSSNSIVGKNNLRFLYYRYKDSPYYAVAVAAVVFTVTLFLFFLVIIPQVESWFSIRSEVIAARDRINTINNNISFITAVDKATLDNQVNTASSALPTEKDFGPIITALSEAAISSGVSLDDFNFQIGNTSSSSGSLNNTNQKDISAIKITILVNGPISGVRSFLKSIGEKLPLSEIEDVDGDNLTTTIKLQFYHKQFPNIVFKDDVPLPQLSAQQQALLQTLSEWMPVQDQELEDTPSSSSAISLF